MFPPFDVARSRDFDDLLLSRNRDRYDFVNQLPTVSILQQSDYLVKLSFMLEIEKLDGFGNHTC
jgi:hypothetical protein